MWTKEGRGDPVLDGAGDVRGATRRASSHFVENKDIAMTKALIAKYENAGAARNAHEDLIDTGFPSEQVVLNHETSQVKAVIGADEREVREILNRHQPIEIMEIES